MCSMHAALPQILTSQCPRTFAHKVTTQVTFENLLPHGGLLPVIALLLDAPPPHTAVMCVCVCVCVYIYKHIHMCMCIHMYIYIHVYTYTHTHTHVYIYTYTRVHTCTPSHRLCTTSSSTTPLGLLRPEPVASSSASTLTNSTPTVSSQRTILS